MTCFTDHEEMLSKRDKKRKGGLSNAEILMWTHYANAHQGICVEYAIPRKTFKSVDDFTSYNLGDVYLEKVKYLGGLAVDYSRVIKEESSDGKVSRLLHSVYFLKDSAFEYERECRLLCFSNDAKAYSSFEFDYIKKIIFGIRCSADTRYIIECINERVYKNKIELYSIDKDFREVPYGSR